MCGIVGVFAKKEQGKAYFPLIETALNQLDKRGPDDSGIFRSENCILGHRRLSIIDTSSGGHQPFIDESKNWIIVFNGEFFNYQEEKEKLIKAGANFTSNSDTEVLLIGFIQHGDSFFKRINGFFSLAIYNIQKGELIVARDRYGVKPLHVFENDEVIIFASELKALLKFNFHKKLDPVSLCNYLHFNYIPDNHSIFSGVRKFTPSCFAKSKNDFIEEKYYQLSNTISQNITYPDAKASLKKLLNDAVKLRLNADVPLGCFLSGGIDSSVITGLAAKEVDKLFTLDRKSVV